ncbi:IclR family transcriptional regulator [Agrobacterium vitis]|uniref:IclR family transcriptional regulator n=1 Tax=Agrobacterium vitis TaxID=373 RepID=UPI0018D251D8|nr:IclR family transcriptional regulator [Agrobacterium vitis]
MDDQKKGQVGERDGAGQDRATVRSVERAFDILGCFSAEHKTITLTEAARAVGLPLSTVSRLLGTLEASQFVRRLADGRYMPGGRLLRIGVVALHGVELYDVSEEYLERLASLTGESANLAIPANEGQVLYLRQVASRHSVRHDNWIGRSVPLEGTAIGDAVSGRVNAEGFSIKHATLEPDVTAVAAPVYGADGQIIAALSITSPSYRVDDTFIARAGEWLVKEARDLSSHLGAPAQKTHI